MYLQGQDLQDFMFSNCQSKKLSKILRERKDLQYIRYISAACTAKDPSLEQVLGVMFWIEELEILSQERVETLESALKIPNSCDESLLIFSGLVDSLVF